MVEEKGEGVTTAGGTRRTRSITDAPPVVLRRRPLMEEEKIVQAGSRKGYRKGSPNMAPEADTGVVFKVTTIRSTAQDMVLVTAVKVIHQDLSAHLVVSTHLLDSIPLLGVIHPDSIHHREGIRRQEDVDTDHSIQSSHTVDC